MSKREAKKDHILCAGLEVMKSHGYNGTSVKDIVDAASVPKGSFYNYFDSKETFAVEALEKVAEEAMASGRAVLSNRQLPPLRRLQQYFELGAEVANDCDYKVGCFFGNMCQEMSDSNDTIRQKVRQILKRKTQLIADVVAEAQSQGTLKKDVEAMVLAEFLFNAWEGALMRMKASRCKEPLDAFLCVLSSITKDA